MDRPADGHLPAEQLSQIYEEACLGPGSLAEAARLHPHLAACSVCRERLEECAVLDRRMKALKSAQPSLRQADCPDPSIWPAVAMGVTATDRALAYIQHASRCDHCGDLLRASVADLNGQVTTAEEQRVAKLESAHPEWQRRLAERISGTPAPESTQPAWWRRWSMARLLPVSAGLVLVAAFGWLITVRENDPQAATHLLAQAYGEQRTLELRIAGAPYAPLRVQRGPEGSFLSRPPALLKAEALIASELASHPSDADWLQAKARADLLEGRYDPAIDSLRRATQLAPNSAELLVDLGTAHFERAEAADRQDDYGVAFESLSKALALQPDNATALYNRAIVSEHQFLYRQALEDWEHYLRIDSSSEWASEARKHADAIRARLNQSQMTPLLSPAQVVALGPDAGAVLDLRIEEYLLAAAHSWLPEAYPRVRSADNPSAAQALFFLAGLSAQRHGDQWLADLLRGASSTDFPAAVQALSRAIQANDAGQYDVSSEQANLAQRLFRKSGNVAGELRARFEEVFSAQMTRRSEFCRQQAASALAQSEQVPYPWLQIQLGLESSVCSGLMGDVGAQQRSARVAVERAERNGYGMVYLRALGFSAGDKIGVGDRSAGWRLADRGLARYWAGQFPPMRGYNLYTELAYAAEGAGWANLQVAIWREAAALIDNDEDLLLRAVAHQSVATAATAAHQPQIAQQQYAEAARLYAMAPQNAAMRAGHLEMEIRTAQSEARLNEIDSAISRLTRVQSEIPLLSNNYLAQLFYSTLGEVQLRRHLEREAEQALRPALSLAEQNLMSLHSESERAAWSRDVAPVYLAMSEAELLQGQTEESLATFEWHLSAWQRTPKGGVQDVAPSLSALMPLLTDQTVIAYGLLPDGLAIWVCDNRGVKAQWIPNADKLQALASRFYEMSSDPGSDLGALRRDSQSLYQILIAPVEQQLAPRRALVIEAEGVLARLPFEALLAADGHYLVERHAIVHSPGQFANERAHADTPISTGSPVVIAASAAAPEGQGLLPIPEIAVEAEAVAAKFQHPRVLQGRNASLSRLSEEIARAEIFHFAGHALALPDRAGLLLEQADSGSGGLRLLDAAAVRHLNLRDLQLAVLSACSTGIAQGDDSTGFQSIGEELLRAGVPHVVASRWAVDSAETREFVEGFYSDLLSGMSVAEAIRSTSRKMLSNPGTAHPYYWSAFAAYGRP